MKKVIEKYSRQPLNNYPNIASDSEKEAFKADARVAVKSGAAWAVIARLPPFSPILAYFV